MTYTPASSSRNSALRIGAGTRLLGTCLLVGLIWAASADAAESADACQQDALCRAHYQRARKQSKDGNYESALSAYQAAYHRRSVPWLLLNIGRTLHKLGQTQEALRYYSRYRAEVATPPPEQEALLTQYSDEAQQELEASLPPGTSAESTESASPAASPQPLLKEKPTAEPEVSPPASAQPVTRLSPRRSADPPVELAAPAALSDGPRREREAPSRAVGLGVTLTVTSALAAAALTTGLLSLDASGRAMATAYVGSPPPPDLVALQARARTLALSTDVLIGAAACSLGIGLLTTLLRRHALAVNRAAGLHYSAQGLALSLP